MFFSHLALPEAFIKIITSLISGLFVDFAREDVQMTQFLFSLTGQLWSPLPLVWTPSPSLDLVLQAASTCPWGHTPATWAWTQLPGDAWTHLFLNLSGGTSFFVVLSKLILQNGSTNVSLQRTEGGSAAGQKLKDNLLTPQGGCCCTDQAGNVTGNVPPGNRSDAGASLWRCVWVWLYLLSSTNWSFDVTEERSDGLKHIFRTTM